MLLSTALGEWEDCPKGRSAEAPVLILNFLRLLLPNPLSRSDTKFITVQGWAPIPHISKVILANG